MITADQGNVCAFTTSSSCRGHGYLTAAGRTRLEENAQSSIYGIYARETTFDLRFMLIFTTLDATDIYGSYHRLRIVRFNPINPALLILDNSLRHQK